jgi:hypothetical protein
MTRQSPRAGRNPRDDDRNIFSARSVIGATVAIAVVVAALIYGVNRTVTTTPFSN